jgi:hypothetical protein
VAAFEVGRVGATIEQVRGPIAVVCVVVLACGSSRGDEVDAGGSPRSDATSCGDGTVFHADDDGDGFGDPALSSCSARPGYVADSSDCDDSNELVNPLRIEACDALDNDCDDTVDEQTCAIGCSDGEREGFADMGTYPDIAGCSGGFQIPGLAIAIEPQCDRVAGDDSLNPVGTGCSVDDLCQPQWTVCATAVEVAAASPNGCAGALGPSAPPMFFASRQSGSGGLECGTGNNDLFGCGNLGVAPGASCTPLDRSSNDLCADLLNPWVCGGDGAGEALNVVKPGAASGGVLCCRE